MERTVPKRWGRSGETRLRMKGRMHFTAGIVLVAVAVLASVASACQLPSGTAEPGASPTAADRQSPTPLSSAPPALVGSPSPGETPSPASEHSSGIFGEVTIGPTCPVIREDSPCPDRPFKAEMVVEDVNTKEAIATIRTDSEGRFRVPLPPGEYYLHPVDPNPGLPPTGKGLSVTVLPGEYTHVSVEYDSGIRSGR